MYVWWRNECIDLRIRTNESFIMEKFHYFYFKQLNVCYTQQLRMPMERTVYILMEWYKMKWGDWEMKTNESRLNYSFKRHAEKELHTQLIRNQTSCAQALERKRRGSECCSLESNSIRLTWSLTRTRGKNHNKIKYRKGASMWPFGISQESLPITFLLCII